MLSRAVKVVAEVINAPDSDFMGRVDDVLPVELYGSLDGPGDGQRSVGPARRYTAAQTTTAENSPEAGLFNDSAG